MSDVRPLDRVPTRPLAQPEPLVWFDLAVGDTPLVTAGDRLGAGDPLVVRLRHPTVAEASLHGPIAPEPGTRFEAGDALAGHGRTAVRFEAAGTVLYRTSAGRVRAVTSRHLETIASPAAICGSTASLIASSA